MWKYLTQSEKGQLSDLRDRGSGTDSVASLSGTAPPAGIQPYRKRLKQCDVLALAFDPQCN